MRHILVVEDEPAVRDLLTRILRRSGYTTFSASNGDEALTHAQQHHPALILMDLILPVLDGWTATERLKADPRTADIPVLALTARLSASDEARAHAAGCASLITKPFNIHTFLEHIAKQIGSPD